MSETAAPTWPDQLRAWIKREPLSAFLAAALIAIVVYAFGFLKLFTNGELSTFVWAWQAWNPETNYEHAKLIPLVVAFLVWNARDKLKVAKLGSSRWGWLFLGFGLFLFFAGARTLQARLCLTSLPFLLFGVVLYVWGREVARILLFPIAFLFFAVPLNFLAQATAGLQFLQTGAAGAVCNLIGIPVHAVGTVVTGSTFRFEVDEGCSGIRSLMAIMMLAAIYGHLTQDRLWKQLAIFAAAIFFAVVGNAGRLVTIFIVARLFGQDFAGGPFHDISGYLSFPFAIVAMLLFSKLINMKPQQIKQTATAREAVSYDY